MADEQPTADSARKADRIRRWAALDTTSGALLLVAAAVAVFWANSPWREAYDSLLHVEVGPEAQTITQDLTRRTASA